MKRFLSALLVLTMVLAIAGSAMADTKFTLYKMVEFKCDSNAYSAAKASKKTNNVVGKGSVAQVRCVSGKYVKLRVNRASKKEMWFKACDLKNTNKTDFNVVWVNSFWFDVNGEDLTFAVDNAFNHAACSSYGVFFCVQLFLSFLHCFLHFLCLTDHVLHVAGAAAHALWKSCFHVNFLLI
jgi:hypothetical protein